MTTDRDLSSLSNPHEVRVTHLDWNVTVDFDTSTLAAEATYTFDRIAPNAKSLILDTNHLVIDKVCDINGLELVFKLHRLKKEHLGRKLEIKLAPFPGNLSFDDSRQSLSDSSFSQVVITYSTTASSSACQWLPPAQTAGKVHPYLFTQCQAIHARSLVPCQDAPGVKMTYNASVTVPGWATCCMSAVLRHENQDGANKVFYWEQKVPISSYLLAMAVGDLAKRDISDRCAVWSEPAMIEATAYEFAQTEDFLAQAESLAGTPYAWGRYDLLCLPPSFPYGGMENPCLTFVTPTLLAKDRSLADVVAHEIAHSWTGNLVTNSTWDHFWLNEGWTTWFQRKIMARIHKDPRFLDFDAIGGWKALEATQSQMSDKFLSLILPIGDNDPDDAYSRVAYEKGFNLLYYLEQKVGTEAFEAFFQKYVAKFSYKTVNSDQFRDFFMSHFSHNAPVDDIDWETWFHGVGMPPVTPEFDRSLSQEAEDLAKSWMAVDRDGTTVPEKDIKSWSSARTTCFLDAVMAETSKAPLKETTVQAMDKAYGFASSQNSEILFRYCMLAVAAEDETMLMVTMHFMTSQGRMKFVRPLYRALFASKMGNGIVVELFLKHKDFYHPIGAKMVAQDLLIDKKKKGSVVKTLALLISVAAVAGAVGFVLMRRRR